LRVGNRQAGIRRVRQVDALRPILADPRYRIAERGEWERAEFKARAAVT